MTFSKQSDMSPDSLSERIPEIVIHLLSRRGFSKKEILSFLFDGMESLHSPFLMEHMEEAVSLLKKVVAAKATIGIFCDNDLDGITSLAIIHSVLTRMAVPFVIDYPDGKINHYGLNKEVIERFAKEGVSLLLTLDCGIRDVDEIALAKQLNMEVIVCDHHEPERLPDCCIVNPKASRRYPYRDLAGAGVAYKLAQALLFSYLPFYNTPIIAVTKNCDGKTFCAEKSLNLILTDSICFESSAELQKFSGNDHVVFFGLDRELYAFLRTDNCAWMDVPRDIESGVTVSPTAILGVAALQSSKKIVECLDVILPLTAIGTVADIVPLNGENRVLLKEGLRRFSIVADDRFIALRGITGERLNAKDVAWSVSPLLNSPGRMACPELTVDFLLKNDVMDNFSKIIQVNSRRKDIVNSLFDGVVAGNRMLRCGNCLYLEGDDIPEGLTGLLATRFSDHYESPVCVVSCAEGALAKGSCRSSIPMLAYLEHWQYIFERFGGHENAMGFSIETRNLQLLRDALCGFTVNDGPAKIGDSAIELAYTEINFAFMADLMLLEPFGAENPFPIIKLYDVPVRDVRALKSVHLKASTDLDFQEIIAWKKYFTYEQEFAKGSVSFCCVPELGEYKGKKKISLIVSNLL